MFDVSFPLMLKNKVQSTVHWVPYCWQSYENFRIFKGSPGITVVACVAPRRQAIRFRHRRQCRTNRFSLIPRPGWRVTSNRSIPQTNPQRRLMQVWNHRMRITCDSIGRSDDSPIPWRSSLNDQFWSRRSEMDFFERAKLWKALSLASLLKIILVGR